ncbi:MAG: 3-deoxy-D-manno-octulosonic acid transferase, partial [Rhodospirillaceae bacterium]|nr:3-deoxy-D-manno-octulosonic acid transferase [Rhodospirillaceae bacterium]
PKSFAGWQRARGLIRTLLQSFTLCLGQSDNDVERLKLLGSDNSKNLGNLKFAVPALPANEEELAKLKAVIGDRPLWLAASTHPGEEEVIASAHKKLSARHHNLLTIIVPRHQTRGKDILQSLNPLGINVALRSKDQPVDATTDIYIADTMGELGLFFRLTEIAFMGKSLVPLGGQNPLEALRLDCAVLHGPHMMNFQWMSEQMIKLGCSLQIENEAELVEAVSQLLSETSRRETMIHHGRAFVDSQSQVVDLVAGEIETILDKKLSGPHSSGSDDAAA